MTCRTCTYRRWITLHQAGAHWTIMGCTLKRLRFGQEADLPRRKADPSRGIVPMPEVCASKKVSA